MEADAAAVAAAIGTAADWQSPPDARKAAVAYLESVKNGDIRSLASISFILVHKDQPSEIRLQGFKMLQHLVRFRWDEFSSSERKDFMKYTLNLLTEVIDPCEVWALKSQTAALVVEVVRTEGVAVWNELFLSLVSVAHKGPAEAEVIAMIMRWLPEDITVHNDDLKGDQRRALVRGLAASLPGILPLLYTLLEKHFVAALNEHTRQQFDLAKCHAATVTAVLNAVNAYADWVPVPDFAKYGLINGCGALLSYTEFRLHSCEFFKIICRRKINRSTDSTVSEFDAAMKSIFPILMKVSREFLSKSSTNASDISEGEYEFAECVCESMVSLGSSNMHCILSDGNMTTEFLQQMLEYYRHYKVTLHYQSLLYWLAVLREPMKTMSTSHTLDDSPSVRSASSHGDTTTDQEKKGMSLFISDELCAVILDVSFRRMLKKNIAITSDEPFELWSNELEGKSDFSQYRAKLLDVIRLVAYQKPYIASARIAERITNVIGDPNHITLSHEDIAKLEGTQLGLETGLSAIYDGSSEHAMGDQQSILQVCMIFEGVLQKLLSFGWREPALVVIHGHFLDAYGPFLKHYPNWVGLVVNKLFELLTTIPIIFQDPSANGARHARLQICSSFIRIAKAADRSLIPHMKAIANTMASLQAEGCLLRAEHNHLCEAFLVTASLAGVQQQQEVLAWLLEPLIKMWTQPDWQTAYLSDPSSLVRSFSDMQFMWSIYHTITFFEKALKRSGVKKSTNPLEGATPSNPDFVHPMAAHLPWILPPLLKLLRCVHALWSEPIAQNLTGEVKSAKSMSFAEQASLLGGANLQLPKGQLTQVDGSLVEIQREDESKENDIRNWLKGIRDSGYNVIGLAASIGAPFYRCIEGSSIAVALVENVQSMEFRHIRLLIHLVIIPVIKYCPSELWEAWLVNLLQQLLLHCQQVLAHSWSCLLREGRAKVPDTFCDLSGLDLKIEVMEEKLLRDLTREVCSVLAVVSLPSLNSGLPSLDQLGSINRADASLKDLHFLAKNSLAGFLMLHMGPAIPALRITIEVLSWTDGDSVTKAISFCGAVIHLAVASNHAELKQFVARELFPALIQGLAFESNAFISSDLVELCRQIYVYLSDRDPAPRQVLLSLPNVTQADLLAFEDALSKTASPKEQKQHMRSLLVLGTGNNLKALFLQKGTNVITNVTVRSRTSAASSDPNREEEGTIGLAGIT